MIYDQDVIKLLEECNETDNYEFVCIERPPKGSGKQSKILLRCKRCNQIYPVLFSVFKKGRRCNCRPRSDQKFREDVEDLLGDNYEVLSEFVNMTTPVKMRHYVCGTEYDVLPTKLLNFNKDGDFIGNKCPTCYRYGRWKNIKSNKDAIAERKMAAKNKNNFTSVEAINELFATSVYDFISKIIPNVRQKKDTIFIPDSNVVILCIPMRGAKYLNNPTYITSLMDRYNEEGIRMITLLEDEWIDKIKIVRNKISYILNVSKRNKKIYARNCVIKEIDTDIKDKFLNKYHIQGKDISSIRLGMFDKKTDTLVSVMTFCRPRRALGHTEETEYDYELSRFASSYHYMVVGGFSKLLSYFKKNYEWEKIVTYADRRWSEGNVYLKNGWTFTHNSKPSYWYTDGKNRYHRYNYRKTELQKRFPLHYSEDKTEKQIMNEMGYRRLYDAGNMVFYYTKDHTN